MTTIRVAPTHWPGHLPGQHADVKLTAADGYRAERSYSIASPPEAGHVEFTVDCLEDGEVSPFLTRELRPNDTLQIRGPIGGYFVWSALGPHRPLLLVAGGTGIVPLMCMLRHRHLSASPIPTILLYSVRTRDDVIFHDELTALARSDPRLTLRITLTRDRGPGWTGAVGRIDLPAIRAALTALDGVVTSFVCGPDGFVDASAGLLLAAGQPPGDIRTERFGPTGA